VPSTLAAELQTNPFLIGLVEQSIGMPLIEDPAVREARFAELRAWKNTFRA
jgi:hypothetical protein